MSIRVKDLDSRNDRESVLEGHTAPILSVDLDPRSEYLVIVSPLTLFMMLLSLFNFPSLCRVCDAGVEQLRRNGARVVVELEETGEQLAGGAPQQRFQQLAEAVPDAVRADCWQRDSHSRLERVGGEARRARHVEGVGPIERRPDD